MSGIETACAAHPNAKKKIGGTRVKKIRSELPCALTNAPRPGNREIRVRMAPDGMRIQNERMGIDGQS